MESFLSRCPPQWLLQARLNRTNVLSCVAVVAVATIALALMGEDKRAAKLAHGDAEVSSQAQAPGAVRADRGAMGLARN